MRVRVKQGCSVGLDGVFHASGAELEVGPEAALLHRASLEPVEGNARAVAFFAALEDEGAEGGAA